MPDNHPTKRGLGFVSTRTRGRITEFDVYESEFYSYFCSCPDDLLPFLRDAIDRRLAPADRNSDAIEHVLLRLKDAAFAVAEKAAEVDPAVIQPLAAAQDALDLAAALIERARSAT